MCTGNEIIYFSSTASIKFTLIHMHTDIADADTTCEFFISILAF